MRRIPPLSEALRVLALAGVCIAAAACAPSAQSAIPPAPVAFRWPDPAFLPERQCQGAYRAEDLERYLSRARLALTLPDTRAVSLDSQARCITIVVESVGAGRLAELVMRGVSVPRAAVLLRLATPVQQS